MADAAALEKINRNLFAMTQALKDLNTTMSRIADGMEKENQDG